MKSIVPVILFFTLFYASDSYAFKTDSLAIQFYQKGLEALNKSDSTIAEKLFEQSIKEDDNAPAQFELAKLLVSKKTIHGRDRARELLRDAIFKDPNNIEYRLLFAALMEYFSSGLAFKEYEEIIEEVDSTNVTALFQLGRIKEDDFNEYNHSVTQDNPDDPMLSLDDYAMKQFDEAEKYLKKVLVLDSTNSQAILHLSFLYEDVGKPEIAVPLLERLVSINPDNKSAHLYLGLIYYKTSNLFGAYNQYKDALKLMDDKDREDFTFNSVKELIEPLFGEKMKDISDIQLKSLIDLYWRVKDPLNLSDYNERLLEHYSRVAYSNLRYGVNKLDLTGWKSDRGKVVLRFGEPINKIRFRPSMNSAGGKAQIKLKTDVWFYSDMIFGFSDDFFNGEYRFAQPSGDPRYISQYRGDSFEYYNYVKRVRNEYYDPKFEGPKFSIPYELAQFKNINESGAGTDIYVNYGIPFADSLLEGNDFVYSHKTGFFAFDKLFNPISTVKDSIISLPVSNEISINDTSDFIVNSLHSNLDPDSVYLSFEVIRSSDKGVASNHLPFAVRSFNKYSLDMSDLVFASKISDNKQNNYPLKRREISILPNPASMFSNKTDIFIYYEVYNLSLDKNGLGNIEQKLTIKNIDEKSGLGKAVNSFLGIFGLDSEPQEVTLTTDYQLHEKNPQLYFQLDMNKYDPGKYLLTIEIIDKGNSLKVSSSKELTKE